MSAQPAVRTRLRIEALEERWNPVNVRFDYSLDTSGFFSPTVRAALDRAAADVTAGIRDELTAITPSGSNTVSATMINGLTNQLVTINNPTINAGEVVVFVVGGQLSSSELGLASGGAYSAQGSQEWLRTIRTRGQTGVDSGTDFATWGGMIAFSANANWNFATSGPVASQYDFQSVATHELLHIFGFGLGNASFDRYTTSGAFTGSHAVSVYGGAVPLQPGADSDHFASGTTYGGQEDVMQPAIRPGVVRRMTGLDYAALRDIGWNNLPDSGTSPPAAVVSPPAAVVSPPPVAVVSPPVSPPPASPSTSAVGTATTGRTTFVVGSGASASPTVYGYGANGNATFTNNQLGSNFAGGVRATVGDFDGDGTPDYAVGSGPGAASEVKVFSGRTGQAIADFSPFGAFTGGVYLAAGDFNGDGRDEIVMSAGAGGGPRVTVRDLVSNLVLADFYGIGGEGFRGGARVAAGDITGDGRPDLVVAAGEGGGPAVALYDGRTIHDRLIPSLAAPIFYAFSPNQTNGVYVAVGDVDGDGHADLICGAGEGGGPAVRVFDGAALSAGRVDATTTFYANDPTGNTGGARVAAADIDGDGLADIVTAPGSGSDGYARVFSGKTARRGQVPTAIQQYQSPQWAATGAYVG